MPQWAGEPWGRCGDWTAPGCALYKWRRSCLVVYHVTRYSR